MKAEPADPRLFRMAGKLFYRIQGYHPVRIHGERFRVDPHHPGFWRIVNRGRFEDTFYEILDTHLKPGDVYCDIGSWIGPTALYAARRCRAVHCFEPDAVAYPHLLKNISLNKLQNVRTYPIAIASHDGTARMASHGGRLGDSMSSLVNIGTKEEITEVETRRWGSWLNEHNPGRIAFIKMDIEGGEVDAVPDMQSYLKREKPVFHLSVHGTYLPRHDRRESLLRMFEALEFYGSCFDEGMKEVRIGDHLADLCQDDFRSWLFIP